MTAARQPVSSLWEICQARKPWFYTEAQMEHGAGFIEPPASDWPLRLDHLIGKSCHISGYRIQACLNAAQVEGYLIEQNEFEEAVIALRRAAARGA